MPDSIDEQPKAKIAKKLVTPTRKYFLPSRGKEVEADSVELAIAPEDETTNTEDVKDGDA